MITQTVSTPMPAMVVAKNNKPQATPEDLIERTQRNWRVVVRYFNLLKPDAVKELAGRWQSASLVTELAARNRCLFAVLNAACDLLVDRVVEMANVTLNEAGVRFDDDHIILGQANSSLMHARVRVLAADQLMYRFEILTSVYRQLHAAERAVIILPSQIHRGDILGVIATVRREAPQDVFRARDGMRSRIWDVVDQLREKAKHVPNKTTSNRCSSRADSVRRKNAKSARDVSLRIAMKAGGKGNGK